MPDTPRPAAPDTATHRIAATARLTGLAGGRSRRARRATSIGTCAWRRHAPSRTARPTSPRSSRAARRSTTQPMQVARGRTTVGPGGRSRVVPHGAVPGALPRPPGCMRGFCASARRIASLTRSRPSARVRA